MKARTFQIVYDDIHRPIGLEIPAITGSFSIALYDEPGFYECGDIVTAKAMNKQQALIVCAYMKEINNFLSGMSSAMAEPIAGGYWLSEEMSPKQQFALAANDGLVCPASKDGLLKVRRVL